MPDIEPLAIDLDDVSYAYGSTVALKGLSLSVPQGIIFGLLGPNGGGKTTLFKLIATLLLPQGGRFKVLNHPLPDGAPEVRARLGIVFQHPSLDKKLTVLENLTHHGHLYGISGQRLRQRADTVIDLLGLSDRTNQIVEKLSGGLQRRVEIAKALLPEPDLLVMDEPSTGLDPGVRLDLWEHLRALHAQGLSILLTTHLLEEAERCDQLALIDQGSLVTSGTPGQLKSDLGGTVVRIDTAQPEKIRTLLEGEGSLTLAAQSITVRSPHSSFEIFARIQEKLRLAAPEIRGITSGPPTLEDVYRAKTGRSWRDSSEVQS
jgi:ABC-2 type transport system ATP-binding protein